MVLSNGQDICPRCGGEVTILAMIDTPSEHLGRCILIDMVCGREGCKWARQRLMPLVRMLVEG